MSEAINQSELADQLRSSLSNNAEKAAEMLITPLNLGVKDLQNLRNQPPFNGLPEASFNTARVLYSQMRKYFGDRLKTENEDLRTQNAEERESARRTAMTQLGSLRNSIVHRGPLTDYLLKNFNSQLNGVEKWSDIFYQAYRSGKTDIRGTAMIGHLSANQREQIAQIYERVYPFLLGQDFGSNISAMNMYGYRKARDIGRCLAYFCSQGVKSIEPSMLTTSINGTSLQQLGIQDDMVKFAGDTLYDRASLKKLNALYEEFLESNGQAQLASLGKEENDDTVAYQTLTPRGQLGNRPFSTKSGETIDQFEKRMADNQAKYRARMKEKGIV